MANARAKNEVSRRSPERGRVTATLTARARRECAIPSQCFRLRLALL